MGVGRKHHPTANFENWWLEVDGFLDLVRDWWTSFAIEGRPNFILAKKLRFLKAKLKEWNAATYENLDKKKSGYFQVWVNTLETKLQD